MCLGWKKLICRGESSRLIMGRSIEKDLQRGERNNLGLAFGKILREEWKPSSQDMVHMFWF